MIRVFTVHGMRCGHCVEILRRNLMRVPGVRRVRVEPRDERVEVDCDRLRTSASVLLAVLRDAGFHPRAVEPRIQPDDDLDTSTATP